MHTAMIRRADVSATGAYAVSGSDDKTVRLWAAPTGQWLRTIRLPQGPGHVGRVYAVAISPDGALVAAGGYTRGEGQPQSIYLFDRDTGALVRHIEGVSSSVLHLAFSPTGRYLAATLWGTGGLRIYDRDAGGREVARDAPYGADSYGAAFAADERLATTSADGTLCLYDRAFQRMVTAKTADGTHPLGLAFSPAGDRLAVSYHDTIAVSLVDGHTLTPLPGPDTRGIDNGNLSSVAWSADGATLYAGGRYDRGGPNPVVAWSMGGAGPRRELAAGTDTVMSLRTLPDGGLLVGSQDPWLGVLDAAGTPRWVQRPPKADWRDQVRTLRVSADGGVVEFGYEVGGNAPARFDLARLALSLNPPADGQARPPEQATLKVEDWENHVRSTLNGAPLALQPYEISHSLAIHPDGRRFVLGTEWWLRAFDADGTPRWTQLAPGIVWATNITADGRLVVAAYGDGTIRWHRMDDGRELLALFPLVDRRNWVAWTPQGFYAASSGAHGILRWHVNRGWDALADAIPVAEIPKTHRPEALRLVLQELDIFRAIGLAAYTEMRTEVQRRTGAAMAPGARLHVLTVGVSDYGAAATHLKLTFAAADATDVAAALDNTQRSLYADVKLQSLTNQLATRAGIRRGLATMRDAMARGVPGRDLAVVQFSGHGAFTSIVLEALSSRADANQNGLISISELTGYLTRHVPGLTNGAQHPGVEMRIDGDVFVAGL